MDEEEKKQVLNYLNENVRERYIKETLKQLEEQKEFFEKKYKQATQDLENFKKKAGIK